MSIIQTMLTIIKKDIIELVTSESFQMFLFMIFVLILALYIVFTPIIIVSWVLGISDIVIILLAYIPFYLGHYLLYVMIRAKRSETK